eukprot:7090150-Prymnesium_polylepis.2
MGSDIRASTCTPSSLDYLNVVLAARVMGEVPVYYLKRAVGVGSRLRANETDSDKRLYGSLDQRDERSGMAFG